MRDTIEIPRETGTAEAAAPYSIAALGGDLFHVITPERGALIAGNEFAKARTDANSGVSRKWTLDEYIDAHDLAPAIEAIRHLLVEMFGPASNVVPRLAQDYETSDIELVLDLITSREPSPTDYETFLDRYLALRSQLNTPESPTLMWNPTRVG